MNTFGVEYTLGVGYRIIENGVKLPMVFKTAEAATHHIDAFLKIGPQPSRKEIEMMVAQAEGDDELSRQASYYHP